VNTGVSKQQGVAVGLGRVLKQLAAVMGKPIFCNRTAASIARACTKTGTGFKESGGQEREQDQLACKGTDDHKLYSTSTIAYMYMGDSHYIFEKCLVSYMAI